MTDFKVALAEFSARQAEREAKAQIELQHFKLAVIPALRQAGIAKVEIRFDGSGDSGAVEEIVCLDAADGSSLFGFIKRSSRAWITGGNAGSVDG